MSLWQTQSWQDMLFASGQTQEYFIIELDIVSSPLAGENGERYLEEQKTKSDITKIFVEKRKVSLGEYGLFVIGFEGHITKQISENLRELCCEENCLFAQIETLDYSLQPTPFSLGGKMNGAKLKKVTPWGGKVGTGGDLRENGMRAHADGFKSGKYYKKFIPPYTAVISLRQSEEEILKSMKPKGRYNIKVAQKNAVQVQIVEKTLKNIQKFYDLIQETTSRDSFAGNTLDYYQRFLEPENTFLFFAEHETDLIAAGIFVEAEDVFYYYYGASSSQKRNLMAPYLLQWEAILYAKKKQLRLYDFLGIASPDETNSPLLGVTDFKLKLTADTRNVSQSFLFIYKKWKYRVIQFLKKGRKK